MAGIDTRDFIRAKRDGRAHDPQALGAFIDAYVRGEILDYQVSAWLMAAFLNGLDARETDALTEALVHSGRVFDWRELGRPSADKHSTGGIGDKISLILAPLVAACGVLVPMVSGRGLGHTGGTLDKLESIPGFRTYLDPDAMMRQLDRIGVVMVGQGKELAPADGKLYALRDVTATVECEPFIVSSIVSKKYAEGADSVVYDVKCGRGAFMKDLTRASRLAHRLVETTRRLGRKARALVTDMSTPLGCAVGNSLEVTESVETLRGDGPPAVRSLTLDLAAEMLSMSGVDEDVATARLRAERFLDSGAAWERFLDLVEAQGGDPGSVERGGGLERAPHVVEITAERDGWLADVDAYRLGTLVVRIGGGRQAKEDAIDPRVGLRVLRGVGDRIARGEPLIEVHLANDDPAAVAEASASLVVKEEPVAAPPQLLERVE